MPRPRRRAGAAAIVVSAAAHLLLLAVIAVQAPRLRIPEEAAGPPLPIIPLLLVPRLPPSASAARPEPLRLHRRLRRNETPPPIAPLPVPAAPASAEPSRPGPVAVHPAPLPDSPKSELRATLRASPIGCANPDAVGLTRAEREACNDQLGKGAKTAAFPGLGLSAAKQAAFDEAAAHKETCRAYRAAPGMGGQPRLRDGPC
jgi:hypothetical protein